MMAKKTKLLGFCAAHLFTTMMAFTIFLAIASTNAIADDENDTLSYRRRACINGDCKEDTVQIKSVEEKDGKYVPAEAGSGTSIRLMDSTTAFGAAMRIIFVVPFDLLLNVHSNMDSFDKKKFRIGWGYSALDFLKQSRNIRNYGWHLYESSLLTLGSRVALRQNMGAKFVPVNYRKPTFRYSEPTSAWSSREILDSTLYYGVIQAPVDLELLLRTKASKGSLYFAFGGGAILQHERATIKRHTSTDIDTIVIRDQTVVPSTSAAIGRMAYTRRGTLITAEVKYMLGFNPNEKDHPLPSDRIRIQRGLTVIQLSILY